MSVSDRAATARKPSPFARKYWPSFRRHVFSLIQMGRERLMSPDLSRWEEPDITGELVRAMRTIVQEPDAPSWAVHLSIHEDPRVNQGGRRGKHRTMLDIRVERTRRGERPHYELEAKRLCKGKVEIGDYLGDDGPGMYLCGAYAADRNEAGMLGYVQTGTVEEWAAALERKLGPDNTATDEGSWRPMTVIPGLPTYRTCHTRGTEMPPIVIYHVLLAFS